MLRSISEDDQRLHFSDDDVLNSNESDNMFSGFQYPPENEVVTPPIITEKDDNVVRHIFETLKPHGYAPKIFCKVPNSKSPCDEVKSRRVTWCIEPLSSENINNIPEKYVEAYGLLAVKQICIDGIALAYPKAVENRYDVFIQELLLLFRSLQNTMLLFVKILLTFFTSTIDKPSTSVKAVPETSLTSPPDPVLLVRVEDMYIEIGRWE